MCRLVVFSALWSALLASALETPCRPVTLVQLDGDSQGGQEALVVHDAGLAYLAGLPSPLYIVSALGVYRSGKSMMLNRCRRLQAPYEGGFGVGHEQRTFTRGIQICAEEVEGLGTVVWMDTEGLWSAEEARSAYGPKIFSLALLFSSTMLLNNRQGLSDQFFEYFGKQQQLARTLKNGLEGQGLNPEALLPSNLTLGWIVQMPIKYDATSQSSQRQLEEFLAVPGDESRARVKRDFHHWVHEVPNAARDSTLWGKLDETPDEDLSPEYLNATLALRARILQELRGARPMTASSAAAQLKMFLDLVTTETFNGDMAKDALEETKSSEVCDTFSKAIARMAGPLPVGGLEKIFVEAAHELVAVRQQIVNEFYLGDEWGKRLDRCLRLREDDWRKRNTQVVMDIWRANATSIVEGSNCYFRGELALLRHDLAVRYGEAFNDAVQKEAAEDGMRMQRTRLVDCMRLGDLLWPIVPWVLGPVCGFYVRGGIGGLFQMALHFVPLVGIYSIAMSFGQLPEYANVNYKVLKNHPWVLEFVMWMPPLLPWGVLAQIFCFCGALRSLKCVMEHLVNAYRTPGAQHTAPQLLNLELKLNVLLTRSQAQFRKDLIQFAQDASDFLEEGRPRAAARKLVAGLRSVANVDNSDHVLGAWLDRDLRQRITEGLRQLRLPRLEPGDPVEVQQTLDELVAQGDLEDLAVEMLRVLQVVVEQRSGGEPGGLRGCVGGHDCR